MFIVMLSMCQLMVTAYHAEIQSIDFEEKILRKMLWDHQGDSKKHSVFLTFVM